MTRELIIDDAKEYLRAALLEDGKLCEIHGERPNAQGEAESLFLGRIQTVKPSLHAAFVDIGSELNAFLPLEDDSALKSGDMIIVQGLAAQTTQTKGLRITTKLNLAGKWLVLTPGQSSVHVSKKVKDPALREALLSLGRRICPPDCGLIIRTASENMTQTLLEEEALSLYSLWTSIQKKALGMNKPGLLHSRLPLHIRLIRDIRDLSCIVINSHAGYELLLAQKAQNYIAEETRIVFDTQEHRLLFDAFNIETQIDKALSKRIWLPCGGYLIVDFCEAMTVIDVNSGKMILGQDLEETALRVNLEAAQEVARQIRLRDLGGIIVVDFIDMKSPDHQHTLMEHMKKTIAADRAQVSVEGITRLGLMEITRKRVHHPLHKALTQSCSYCSGVGSILMGEETARRAIRQIRRMALSGQRGPFIVRCCTAAAQALCGMYAPNGVQIYALAGHGRHSGKYDIEQIGAGFPIPTEAVALKNED